MQRQYQAYRRLYPALRISVAEREHGGGRLNHLKEHSCQMRFNLVRNTSSRSVCGP